MNHDLILLDIDTQEDFFLPAGSLYTGAAEVIRTNIYKLFGWAKRKEIPIISTTLRLTPGAAGPYGTRSYCQQSTHGEMKLSRTRLMHSVNLGIRNISDLPGDLFEHYQQVIVERSFMDVFRHQRLERLIMQNRHARFVVCGAGLCRSVVQAVIGLCARGIPTIVPVDSVLNIVNDDTQMVWKRMLAKNALLTHAHEVTKSHSKLFESLKIAS